MFLDIQWWLGLPLGPACLPDVALTNSTCRSPPILTFRIVHSFLAPPKHLKPRILHLANSHKADLTNQTTSRVHPYSQLPECSNMEPDLFWMTTNSKASNPNLLGIDFQICRPLGAILVSPSGLAPKTRLLGFLPSTNIAS